MAPRGDRSGSVGVTAPRPKRLGAKPPSGAPVRAQSKAPDDPVLGGFNRRLSYREHQLVGEAFEAFFVRSRTAERRRSGRALRCGEVWRSAGAVLDYLAGLATSCDQVYPAVEAIAERCGLAESTVHEVKDQLRTIGILDWRHRAVVVEDAGPGEPPIRQTSNLYRVNELPPRLLACLKPERRATYALELAEQRKRMAARARKGRADAQAKADQLRRRPMSDLERRLIAEALRPAATPGAPGEARDSS